MTPELEIQLVTRYPEIFRDAGGNPSQTAMAWGLAIGDGWFDLIDVLCRQLVAPLRREEQRLTYLTENLGQVLRAGAGASPITPAMVDEQRTKVDAARESVPVAAQVKEKFGGLRFYVHGASPEQRAQIDLVEELSYRACETCGNPGQAYSIGWVGTLCPAHADEKHGPAAAAFRAKNKP